MAQPGEAMEPLDPITLEVIGAKQVLAALLPDSAAGAARRAALPFYSPLDDQVWRAHRARASAVDAWALAQPQARLSALRLALGQLPGLQTPTRRLAAHECLRDADLFTLKQFLFYSITLLDHAGALLAQWVDVDPLRAQLAQWMQQLHPEQVATSRFHLSDALDQDLARARRAVRSHARRARRARQALEQELLADYTDLHISLDDTVRIQSGETQRAALDPRLMQTATGWALRAPEGEQAAASLSEEAAACEQRVRVRLSQLLAPHRAALLELEQLWGELDLLLAMHRLRVQWGGCWPQWSQAQEVVLEQGHAPTMPGAQPVSLTLGELPCLLTGPNMGGKSSLLKLVGLCQWCMQSGLPVPARAFRARAVHAIIYTGSDEPHQAASAQGLSSFGREIRRLVTARTHTSPALWLLDEPGRGTHPQEGARLARSIIEVFQARGDTILATTHFPQLANMPGVSRWRIKGLADRGALEESLRALGDDPDALEAALHAAMDYGAQPVTSQEDAIPRDARMIARLLGW